MWTGVAPHRDQKRFRCNIRESHVRFFTRYETLLLLRRSRSRGEKTINRRFRPVALSFLLFTFEKTVPPSQLWYISFMLRCLCPSSMGGWVFGDSIGSNFFGTLFVCVIAELHFCLFAFAAVACLFLVAGVQDFPKKMEGMIGIGSPLSLSSHPQDVHICACQKVWIP